MPEAIYMEEARRLPCSEWIKDHPRPLEALYRLTRQVVVRIYPLMRRLSPTLAERVMIWGEVVLKGWIFNCQMCGQCILHSTGMTCPMTCPKKLRNGPCGGVRHNNHCEVIPERLCVWVQAWERSQDMRYYADDMRIVQPPVDHALRSTSAWVNMVEGRDTDVPPGWALDGKAEEGDA
ncbi:MAG: methylenetetrahydrofolate reductase C-terminal domain-containing protein [Anaerolineae bacterium]